MLYMFQAVSPPIIRSSKPVHTASGICQACLLLPVAASKLGIYEGWNFNSGNYLFTTDTK